MAQRQPQQQQGLTWGKALGGIATVGAIALAASAVAVGVSDATSFGEIGELLGGENLMNGIGEAAGKVGDAFMSTTDGAKGVFPMIGDFFSGMWEQVTEAFKSITTGFGDGLNDGADALKAGDGFTELNSTMQGGLVDKTLYTAAHTVGEYPIISAAAGGAAAAGAVAVAANNKKTAKGPRSAAVLKERAAHAPVGQDFRSQVDASRLAALHAKQTV